MKIIRFRAAAGVAALFSIASVSCASIDNDPDAEISKLVSAQDFDVVVQRLLPAAKRGDPARQFAVGYFMLAAIEKPDRTVPPTFNANDAIRWLYEAAITNSVPQAAGMISDGFKNGWFGLKKNADAASCWRRISAGRKFDPNCSDPRVQSP